MADQHCFILLERKGGNIMANFCTKCGRKLINGQPCICTQEKVENTQEDVSWVEPIQTITFTNKDDIDYLYNQLSQLKTLNKSGSDDENEVEAPKKRTIQSVPENAKICYCITKI